jgi:hypothetical protein
MAYNISLPQMRGLSEKEQLAEMRKYLYQQAEQLQFEFNNLESGGTSAYQAQRSAPNQVSTSAIFGAIKSLIGNSDEIAENLYKKLAERGTAEGWTYIKWLLGGTYEMYGRFTVTPETSEKGTALYLTNAITIKTPFKIAEDAVITGTGEGAYWISSGGYADADNISIKLISDTAITEAVTVRLRVVGTYVTNTEEENGDSQSN